MADIFDVVIVIVGYKMKGLIRTCLRSLKESSANSTCRYQVVVVDNDSRDGTIEMLREEFPEVVALANDKNVGFAGAVNHGIRSGQGRYYLVLNPDIYFPEAGLLPGMVKWMDEHPKIGMLGPRLKYPSGQIQPSCFRLPGFWVPFLHRALSEFESAKKQIDNYLMADFDHNTEREVDGVFGAAMLARAEAVEKVGLMDDRNFFMFFEDIDWCRRFGITGWPVMYVPQYTLIHYHGRPSAGGWFNIFTNKVMRMHIKSWLKYFWKWRHGKI